MVVLDREVNGRKLRDYDPASLDDAQLAVVLTAYWKMDEVQPISTQLLPAEDDTYDAWLKRLSEAAQPIQRLSYEAYEHMLDKDVTVRRLAGMQRRIMASDALGEPQKGKLSTLTAALLNLRVRELVALTSIDRKPHPKTIALPNSLHWEQVRQKLLDEIDPAWRQGPQDRWLG